MATGMKDRTAVIGMGCTRFGERYDCGKEDLMVEAVGEALQDAGIEFKDIDAFWFGTMNTDYAGTAFSRIMKSQYKPVTRVENFCCTGSDAFRNACYAVASGEYDVVMAIGLEKLKDSGMSGLFLFPTDYDRTEPEITAPAVFGMLAPAYAAKYGVTYEQLREAMVCTSHKNHYNGSLNPKAMFRQEVPIDQIKKSPMVAPPYMTVMDCSGVSDGCACAIITRAEEAPRYRKDPMYVKALEMVTGPAHSQMHQSYDFTTIVETSKAAENAYRKAGITDPCQQISLAEVHDCFTITELILCEDLGFSERGQAWKDILNGKFAMNGALPVNIDGGLKSFGHPIGASGLRMIYESWLQFHGRAGKRQLEDPKIGLAHNLGGMPWCGVVAITIVGQELG